MTEAAACRRCGTCCAKGGPALHLEDLPLLERGPLARHDLYTLRADEPVHDQVLGLARLLESDCVKIRSAPGSVACIFLRDRGSACALYAHRPLECRALQCQETATLAVAVRRPRLSRIDVVGAQSPLAELIRDHEKRCSCAMLLALLRLDTGKARRALQRSRDYDAALRELFAEQRAVKPGEVDFLLGRPLDVVIRGLARWRDMKG